VSFRIRLTRGAQKQKLKLTAFDSFTRLAFRIFGAPSTGLTRNIPLLRDSILRSNLRITPEGLVSVALFATMISTVFAVIGIYVGFGVYHVPYFLALIAAVPLVFTIVINMPKISASSRAASMDIELPFVVGYISVLAGGGVSPLATLRRIASMNLFPASAKEAKRILLEVDVFGQDPTSAIERIARWNPSRVFSEFLFGYTAILKSGGNFMAYVQSKLRDIMENKAAAVKLSLIHI